ncbi:MAG: 4-hydroxy-tetrahydrodipicolinate reductase [Clostridia bacterium]|nr:4-hydroxy-tetrahydrodipicolinate reductase [Clostridia bacterium]
MIKIIIGGALGKMGKKVFDRLSLSSDLKPVCGVDIKEDFSNPDFPIYSSYNEIKEDADALIDFSSPKALNSILEYITKNKIPSVLCATGYTDEQEEMVKKASENVAIFRSANMSLGVNVLIKAVKEVAKSLLGFDIEIIEKHHNQKVDAPSGTALMIADAIKTVDNNKYLVNGRNGIVGKRNADEIGIHSIRGGNIVGEHQVIFAGENETITLTHEATDRSIFAVGAEKAVRYITTKNKGLFDYNDLLEDK